MQSLATVRHFHAVPGHADADHRIMSNSDGLQRDHETMPAVTNTCEAKVATCNVGHHARNEPVIGENLKRDGLFRLRQPAPAVQCITLNTLDRAFETAPGTLTITFAAGLDD
jgi:hypothetical protein